MRQMVGAVRFELTTSCTRNKRASQATLRPVPKCGGDDGRAAPVPATVFSGRVGEGSRRDSRLEQNETG